MCYCRACSLFWIWWAKNSCRPIEPAHGDRPEAEVIAGGELVVHAIDYALGGHAPIVGPMEVAIDAGGCAGSSDPAGEFGWFTVEEGRVVEHDNDRLHAGGELARGC